VDRQEQGRKARLFATIVPVSASGCGAISAKAPHSRGELASTHCQPHMAKKGEFSKVPAHTSGPWEADAAK